MTWTLSDLRHLLLRRSVRTRWLHALRALCPRNLTNFGDLV